MWHKAGKRTEESSNHEAEKNTKNIIAQRIVEGRPNGYVECQVTHAELLATEDCTKPRRNVVQERSAVHGYLT